MILSKLKYRKKYEKKYKIIQDTIIEGLYVCLKDEIKEWWTEDGYLIDEYHG